MSDFTSPWQGYDFSGLSAALSRIQEITRPALEALQNIQSTLQPIVEALEQYKPKVAEIGQALLQASRRFSAIRKMGDVQFVFWDYMTEEYVGNVKKCAVGKYPKSEKHGNTAQFSEVERSGTQENCGGIGSGCRLRLRPLPVLRRRQSQRVARIDPNAVVVDKNIAENDRFDLFSR